MKTSILILGVLLLCSFTVTTTRHKPLFEFGDACDGIKDVWNRFPDNEVFGYITSDGKIIVADVLSETGGQVTSLYKYDSGKYFYSWPITKGDPKLNYAGLRKNKYSYYIPVVASFHTHITCRNSRSRSFSRDNSRGVKRLGEEDVQFASTYPNIKHYVIGCDAIAQFDSDQKDFFGTVLGDLGKICLIVNQRESYKKPSL